MKHKLNIALLLMFALASVFQSCNDDETYADKRKRENKQIAGFIQTGAQVKSADDEDEYLLNIPGNIKVISESDFYKNDSTTDVSKNEYVYFNRTGVYMQIVSKGDGEKIADDSEPKRVLVRYTEFNIAGNSIQTSNGLQNEPDIVSVTNTSGSFTGTFLSGMMYDSYKSSAAPPAWLVPFTYVKLTRDTRNLAHVRLIVPGSYGQANASANVYPCFYDITYQMGR